MTSWTLLEVTQKFGETTFSAFCAFQFKIRPVCAPPPVTCPVSQVLLLAVARPAAGPGARLYSSFLIPHSLKIDNTAYKN